MATLYQFGKFVLNVEEQLLTADGRAVHLPTKEFETLQMLVENNGKILSKDEMMSAIWKETFVEESNLAQYVSRLRKILNVDGNQYIKTISKRGYRFSAEVKVSDGDLIIERHLRVKVGGNGTRTLSEINSVAVLPFQSLGSPAEDEFFGLGITDALITQLTRTGNIITRPTTSVMKFRSADQDPFAIAALLNVDAILEGNFQKSGNRLRLTAQLLDAESGKTLWAESFNTEIDDIFDVQDRIAERIVNAFSKQYSEDTGGGSTKRYTENKSAYQEYLKGRFNFSKRTAEGLTKALRNFEAAIEIDPLYALAYAGMAEVYQLLPLSDEMEPHSAFPKAKKAVLRALELDDAIPEAHVSLGVILMDFDWNWHGAELSFQKAIALNPNYAAAHQVYGTLLLRLGRIGDAILELKKAQQLDPLSPAINTWMAEAFAHLGEHAAAIRILNETIKSAPDYLFAYYFLVQSYVRTGQLAEAATAAEEAVKLSDDMSLTRSASIFLKAQIGDAAAARGELRGLLEKRHAKYVSAVNIASGFAVLNETDEVFKWLDVALEERDSNLTWLNVDREFDYLRNDPRFRAIARKVHLPDSESFEKASVSSNVVSDPEPQELPPVDVDAKPGKRWVVPAVIGVSAIVLAVAGYLLMPFSWFRGSHAREKNTLTRLTDAPFDEANPTFTRDGQIRFLRFVDKRTAVPHIMNADGTGVREDVPFPGFTSGIYSPDGTKVFYHKGAGDPMFYLANVDGSEERAMPFHPGNCGWSPDSKQFLYQSRGSDTAVPNNSDIFIYTLETGAITPVVESPFFDSDPIFSPDGKSIAYASDVEGNFEIYTRVLATGETKRLTYGPGHEAFPSYSPDGTQIIFNSDVEKENTDVYLMNVDGSNVRKITDAPGWDACPSNCWSPDGTQVLLLSDRGGNENIYVMNIEPTAPRHILPNVEGDQPIFPGYSPSGEQIAYLVSNEIRIYDTKSKSEKVIYRASAGGGPSFSPDGGKILFQDRIDENTEICSINIDGTGFTNISQNASRDMSPAYSPDGTKIAFAASRAFGTTIFEIYVMNADGSDPRLVFGDRAMSVGPTWGPDGKSLVFSNDREDGRIGNFELFAVDIDGGTEKRLTKRAHYDVDPAFSPDGKRIAFVSNTDGNPEIYVMNADGSGILRLTRDLGKDFYPHWSPDGSKLIFTSDRSGKFALYEIDL
jgi:Tol biopolymer transport system component/TolB-like protein/DNA-binding winged helix-turn-helix (wHTH) protein/Tfp pilus assembly protein PilF